jgi:hypothetical protein
VNGSLLFVNVTIFYGKNIFPYYMCSISLDTNFSFHSKFTPSRRLSGPSGSASSGGQARRTDINSNKGAEEFMKNKDRYSRILEKYNVPFVPSVFASAKMYRGISNSIFLVVLFFVAQSSLCMDIPAEKNEPLVVRLEDGHEWRIMRQWQDAQQFAGLYVAYRTHDEALIAGAYHIDPCATYYGSVSLEQCRWMMPDHVRGQGHVLYKALFVPNPPAIHGFNLTNDRLRSCKLSMRLLTLAEACHLDARLRPEGSSARRLVQRCLGQDGKMPALPKEECITLCNVLQAEQYAYIWNQVRKTIWQKQCLLHIATKDTSSILCGFPRDLIRLITRHLIAADAERELQKADPKMRLLFEHKKELP